MIKKALSLILLIVVGEVSLVLVGVVQHWLEINYASPMKTRINQDAMQRVLDDANEPYYQQHPEERPPENAKRRRDDWLKPYLPSPAKPAK